MPLYFCVLQLLTDRLHEIGRNHQSIMAVILSLRLSRLQNLPRDNEAAPHLLPSPIPAPSTSLNTAPSSLWSYRDMNRRSQHLHNNPHHPYFHRKKYLKAFQQQLAMETIQIWSPLSHQVREILFLLFHSPSTNQSSSS